MSLSLPIPQCRQEPLRQLDTAVVAKRNLATFLYQEASPTQVGSQEAVLNKLAALGFSVNPTHILADSIEAVWEFIEKIAQGARQSGL